MYYHILLFTNMFRSLLQQSWGYHTRIQKIIYFKCADIECCETVFLFHWRLQTAEILQLELTNEYFYNWRENFDINTSRLLFSQKVLPLMHFTNCQFGSRSLSKRTLWSDRKLAATSSVTKQAQSTIYNSTDCNAKQTAGNCKWLHIDRLFPAVTAIWHTYQ